MKIKYVVFSCPTPPLTAQPALEQSTRSRAAPVKPAPAPAKTKNKVCPGNKRAKNICIYGNTGAYFAALFIFHSASVVEPVVRILPTRSAARSAAPVQKDKPRDNPAGKQQSKAMVDTFSECDIKSEKPALT